MITAAQAIAKLEAKLIVPDSVQIVWSEPRREGRTGSLSPAYAADVLARMRRDSPTRVAFLEPVLALVPEPKK